MKILKKIIALTLCALMLLSFSGCHKKNELAVTVGDVEFTSAYYMCALINADMEARSLVEAEATANQKEKGIDYYSTQLDDKDYVDWVEEKTFENLKAIAAYKILCKENKIELAEEEKTYNEQYADFYWTNYGYASLYEANGVSKETFIKYLSDSAYASLYFDHLYGKGGAKEVPADEINKTMSERFILVDNIGATFNKDDGTQMTNDEIAALKTKFQDYATAIQKGTKTFEQVYHEHNGTKESEDTANDTSDTDALKPINRHALIIGDKDSGYESDDFETVKAMALNEAKYTEVKDNGGVNVYVKRDLAADKYYIEQLDSTIRHLLKDEEYNKEIEEYAKKLELKKVDYAVKQFKVKKIVYPETQG